MKTGRWGPTDGRARALPLPGQVPSVDWVRPDWGPGEPSPHSLRPPPHSPACLQVT